MSDRIDMFRKEFDKDWFKLFRSGYENINADRPMEGSSVKYEDTYSGFRDLLSGTDARKEAFVDEMLPHLGRFLHGPFPLPGRRVVPSAWDCRNKLGAYEASGVIPLIKGAKVLDIGCNAGYDSFLMSTLGATETVGLEPHGFYHQAAFLNAIYEIPSVRFMNLGWEDIQQRYFKGFDFVNCQGLIYHVKEPMNLIERIAAIMKPGATLLMETHVLSESTTQSQFIEGAFWGDESYWWIFGDKCLSGMLRSAGFKDIRIPLKADCGSRNPLDAKHTVEGLPAGARAWFVATRA